MHARHDPRVTTLHARQTFLASFEQQVDPDGLLPEAERIRRALSLRKAHFTRLAFKSAKARRQRKERRNGGSDDGGK